MPKLANGCRLFLPLFENSHGVARTYYYGTAHPSRLGRAGCSGRCRHGSQKFAVALGLVRRLSRSSIASTVESGLKTLRSSQSGKPVKPTASTGFLERAMGIEPTSEAWEAYLKARKTPKLAAFLRFSVSLKWIPIGAGAVAANGARGHAAPEVF